jgi:hypothetical protein
MLNDLLKQKYDEWSARPGDRKPHDFLDESLQTFLTSEATLLQILNRCDWFETDPYTVHELISLAATSPAIVQITGEITPGERIRVKEVPDSIGANGTYWVQPVRDMAQHYHMYLDAECQTPFDRIGLVTYAGDMLNGGYIRTESV